MFVVVLFWWLERLGFWKEIRVLNCKLIDRICASVVVICLGMLICWLMNRWWWNCMLLVYIFGYFMNYAQMMIYVMLLLIYGWIHDYELWLLMIVVVNVISWIGYDLCWVVVDCDDFEWMWSLSNIRCFSFFWLFHLCPEFQMKNAYWSVQNWS
jgi:hypothetical protein